MPSDADQVKELELEVERLHSGVERYRNAWNDSMQQLSSCWTPQLEVLQGEGEESRVHPSRRFEPRTGTDASGSGRLTTATCSPPARSSYFKPRYFPGGGCLMR